MIGRPIICAAATLLMATACSDTKSASDSNFRKALEPAVRNLFCSDLSVDRMSMVVGGDTPALPIVIPAEPYYPQRPETEARAILEQATAAGLLTRKASTEPARRYHLAEELTPRRAITYQPTQAGERYFRGVAAPSYAGVSELPKVCSASGEVVDIVRWTEPASMTGQTMTRVTFTFRGADPMPTLTPEQRAQLETPRERTEALILASDGWRLPG